jgi:hypothetical protein
MKIVVFLFWRSSSSRGFWHLRQKTLRKISLMPYIPPLVGSFWGPLYTALAQIPSNLKIFIFFLTWVTITWFYIFLYILEWSSFSWIFIMYIVNIKILRLYLLYWLYLLGFKLPSRCSPCNKRNIDWWVGVRISWREVHGGEVLWCW